MGRKVWILEIFVYSEIKKNKKNVNKKKCEYTRVEKP